MNPLLNYGIQVIIISGLLYSYYHFVLRNKKFHRYNRFYLLGAAGLSLVLPLLNIPVYFSEAETESSFVYNTLTVLSGTGNEEAATVYAGLPEKENGFTLTHILQLIYLSIAGLVLLRIIFSLLKINRIIRRHTVEKIGKIHFLNTEEPGTPFSFFRWLFWNRKIELNSAKGEQIFRHELFHIEQKHSLDILFLELLAVVGWFNPFFHLMKRETRAIHEFLADQFAVTENNRWDYAELLLMQALHTSQRLVHPFFHNQVKRRIAMITSPQKTSHQYLRKLMVLPVTALAVILFAFSYKNSKQISAETAPAEKQTIIIDVSHGGKEPGAIGADGTQEKDLVLAIAKKIKLLNQNGQYNIVLTRESDFLPDLKSRVNPGNGQAPALLLSLHINSSPDIQKTGIEVFIPKSENKHFPESKTLASILMGKFAESYLVAGNILQRKETIWVLENSNCPAALIEIGYISSEKDLAFVRNDNNQESIAKNILKAIEDFITTNHIKTRNSLLPSPNDTTIKPIRNMAVIGKMLFISDSIIFRSAPPQDPKNNIPGSITFMNGKRIFKKDYEGKAIICDSVEIYSAEDKKAIELYGPQARSGAVVIHNGKITDLEIKEADKPESGKVFDKVEIEAAFPGGTDAWRKYLERNLDGQVPLKNKAPKGVYTVIVQFIVNTDGSISDTRALTHHGYGMEEEAIRVIRKGPKWLPAIQNGRQVVAYRKQPITFVADNGPGKESKANAGQGKVLNEVVVVGYSEKNTSAVKTANKEIILYNTTQVKNSKTGYVLKLAADELYIGIDNIFRFEALGININELVAEITPNGRVEIKKDEIIINVNSISESHLLSLYITEGNKKTLLKTIQFKVRLIPQSEINKRNAETKNNGAGTAILTSTPEISVSRLKTITVCEALGLPAGTEVISYNFTIDKDNGDIFEIPNTGIAFNPATKRELQTATAGKMMTFDLIRIRVDGKEKRVPSRVYLVVN